MTKMTRSTFVYLYTGESFNAPPSSAPTKPRETRLIPDLTSCNQRRKWKSWVFFSNCTFNVFC